MNRKKENKRQRHNASLLKIEGNKISGEILLIGSRFVYKGKHVYVTQNTVVEFESPVGFQIKKNSLGELTKGIAFIDKTKRGYKADITLEVIPPYTMSPRSKIAAIVKDVSSDASGNIQKLIVSSLYTIVI